MTAAVYMRVSSDDQRERGTIENQRIYAKKWVDLHDVKVWAYYAEDGVSGRRLPYPTDQRDHGCSQTPVRAASAPFFCTDSTGWVAIPARFSTPLQSWRRWVCRFDQ